MGSYAGIKIFDKVKFLGYMLNSKLNNTDHVEYISKKIEKSRKCYGYPQPIKLISGEDYTSSNNMQWHIFIMQRQLTSLRVMIRIR